MRIHCADRATPPTPKFGINSSKNRRPLDWLVRYRNAPQLLIKSYTRENLNVVHLKRLTLSCYISNNYDTRLTQSRHFRKRWAHHFISLDVGYLIHGFQLHDKALSMLVEGSQRARLVAVVQLLPRNCRCEDWSKSFTCAVVKFRVHECSMRSVGRVSLGSKSHRVVCLFVSLFITTWVKTHKCPINQVLSLNIVSYYWLFDNMLE